MDSFSKWPEVVRTKEITTAATIRMLRGIFARFGAPETLVTDNGTQFTSDAFESYCEKNAIIHLKTARFHPQSNGLAERFVDTFKRSLKKITAGGETLDEAIDTFLQCYRSTPCRSGPGGKSPAENLVGHPLRTSLALLRPPTQFQKIENPKQEAQFNKKHGTKARDYSPQDLVWAKVFRNNKWTWEAGKVVERLGAVMYNIWLNSKQTLIRSHCNQLRTRYAADEQQHSTTPADPEVPLSILLDNCGLNATSSPEAEDLPALPEELQQGLQQPTQPLNQRRPTSNQKHQPIPTRQSTRVRRPPVRYEPYQLF